MIGAVVFDASELSDSTLLTDPRKTSVIRRAGDKRVLAVGASVVPIVPV